MREALSFMASQHMEMCSAQREKWNNLSIYKASAISRPIDQQAIRLFNICATQHAMSRKWISKVWEWDVVLLQHVCCKLWAAR
jgi:hypothetical protein